MTAKQTQKKRLLSKKIKPWHVAALFIIAGCYLILQFTLSHTSSISQPTPNAEIDSSIHVDTNKDRTQKQ